jgi:hypothetical protein
VRSTILTLGLAGVLSTGIVPRAGASASFDWGFIASRHEDVNGDRCFKAAGPFFQRASSTQDWHMVAVRPLYSSVLDPDNDRRAKDWLWPVATQRRFKNDVQSRYLIFYHYNHEVGNVRPRYRFWLFPFYFQGRDATGAHYRAVFPLGGSIHEFLGRDEISFILFPIQSKSRLNEVKTSNWLWPLISTTHGDRVERYRVFPFYARSELKDSFKKQAVLWPFWNHVRYDYPGSSGSGFILFPVYGHVKLEDQETWWIVPPFIRYTDGRKMDMLYLPWPFFQRVRSASEDRTYLWPLWGHKRIENVDRQFFLWPLGRVDRRDRGATYSRAFQLIPFYYSSSTRRKPSEGATNVTPKVEQVYRKLWPVCSYRREGDQSRFKALELWPFAESSAVERNWSPLWTLYRKDARADRRQCELLWGLYRHHRDEDRRFWSLFPLFTWERDNKRDRYRHWSILKGLIGRERDDSHRRWRLLYFMTFRSEQEPKP